MAAMMMTRATVSGCCVISASRSPPSACCAFPAPPRPGRPASSAILLRTRKLFDIYLAADREVKLADLVENWLTSLGGGQPGSEGVVDLHLVRATLHSLVCTFVTALFKHIESSYKITQQIYGKVCKILST